MPGTTCAITHRYAIERALSNHAAKIRAAREDFATPSRDVASSDNAMTTLATRLRSRFGPAGRAQEQRQNQRGGYGPRPERHVERNGRRE